MIRKTSFSMSLLKNSCPNSTIPVLRFGLVHQCDTAGSQWLIHRIEQTEITWCKVTWYSSSYSYFSRSSFVRDVLLSLIETPFECMFFHIADAQRWCEHFHAKYPIQPQFRLLWFTYLLATVGKYVQRCHSCRSWWWPILPVIVLNIRTVIFEQLAPFYDDLTRKCSHHTLLSSGNKFQWILSPCQQKTSQIWTLFPNDVTCFAPNNGLSSSYQAGRNITVADENGSWSMLPITFIKYLLYKKNIWKCNFLTAPVKNGVTTWSECRRIHCSKRHSLQVRI